MKTRTDWLTAAAIFVAVLGVTLAAAPHEGINRDEAYYMAAGEQYIAYWEHTLTGQLSSPLSDASISRYWEYNHEHPPLMKLLYGLSWRLFHDCHCAVDKNLHPGPARLESGKHRTIPIFSWESTAFRLPTMVFFALLAALVYFFFIDFVGGCEPSPPPHRAKPDGAPPAFGQATSILASRAGGIAAAFLTAAQPRAFFHAQTAGFDLPAAALWFATVYAYWRALYMPRWRPAILAGVLYGLFLATKLQSFFLPLALAPHWLWLVVRALRKKGAFPSWRTPLAMVVVGPLVFFLLWPWLWHDTIHRLGEYIAFHLHHVHYNFEYLGVNYNSPPYPKTEPLGMLVTTAPVILLALAAGGMVILFRRWRGRTEPDPRATTLLVFLSAFVPIALFFQGTTPIFGETKHWLATMPYLALCAGVAVQAIGAALIDEWNLAGRGRVAALAALVTLVGVAVAPAVVETARSEGYGLSHYNALAGGAPGGADLGMNRQFWGYSVAGLLDWFNATLPKNTKIYTHDWNHDAFMMYLRDRRLRADLGDTALEEPGIRASSAALVIHEKHFNKYEYMIWDDYHTVQPANVLTLDGVPLVTVYTRPTPEPAKP